MPSIERVPDRHDLVRSAKSRYRFRGDPDISTPPRRASDQVFVTQPSAEKLTRQPLPFNLDDGISTSLRPRHRASAGSTSRRKRHVAGAHDTANPSAQANAASYLNPASAVKSLFVFVLNIVSSIGRIIIGFLALFQVWLEFLGSLMTTSIDLAKNVATSAILPFIVSCLSVLVIGLVVLGTLAVLKSGAAETYAEPKSSVQEAITLTKSTAFWSYNYPIRGKSFLLQVSAYSVGLVGSMALTTKEMLCRWDYSVQAVNWFNGSCITTAVAENVIDALNVTAVGVGQWGNASSLLIPYSDYFKSANLAVGQTQVAIAITPVDFEGKAELIQLMSNFSDGLLWSGRRVYDTVLETEVLLFMMLHHFLDTQSDMRQIDNEDSIWIRSWYQTYQTYQIEQMLHRLPAHLDTQLLALVKSIDHLEAYISDTGNRGTEYAQKIGRAQAAVDEQMASRGLFFKFYRTATALHEMRRLLVSFHFPLAEIAHGLNQAKVKLGDLRSSLVVTNNNVHAYAYTLKEKAPQILGALEHIVGRLTSTMAHMEMQRANERDRWEFERKQGMYTFPTTSHRSTEF